MCNFTSGNNREKIGITGIRLNQGIFAIAHTSHTSSASKIGEVLEITWLRCDHP